MKNGKRDPASEWIRQRYPNWPDCAADCGWPLNPAATLGMNWEPGTFAWHPTCLRPKQAPAPIVKGQGLF